MLWLYNTDLKQMHAFPWWHLLVKYAQYRVKLCDDDICKMAFHEVQKEKNPFDKEQIHFEGFHDDIV